MQDVLRVFEHFQALKAASVHMVEVSPQLSNVQAMLLCMKSSIIPDPESLIHRQGITTNGIPINWYRKYEDVPKAFTLLIAHEFFDALPIHKFQKTDKGYREVLIDIDEEHFRYVLAREETPASKVLISTGETREHVEISIESVLLMKEITRRIVENGGLALIADYGHDGTSKDSFRAFKKHKLHDPLVEPGSADLTADVDFSCLKKVLFAQRCKARLFILASFRRL